MSSEEEAHFHWVMFDFEDLLTRYGGELVLKHMSEEAKKCLFKETPAP